MAGKVIEAQCVYVMTADIWLFFSEGPGKAASCVLPWAAMAPVVCVEPHTTAYSCACMCA